MRLRPSSVSWDSPVAKSTSLARAMAPLVGSTVAEIFASRRALERSEMICVRTPTRSSICCCCC